MSPLLGQVVLAVHVAVIAFNVLGMVAIPVGAALRWGWVRVFWWRALHVACWLVVAAQAALGRACFLTDWQGALTGGATGDPLIMRWVNGLIYWPLPMWAFTALYLVLFALVVALWWLAPPEKRIVRKNGDRRPAMGRDE